MFCVIVVVRRYLDNIKTVGVSRSIHQSPPPVQFRRRRWIDPLTRFWHRNLDVSGVTVACEYLADKGLIGKASVPVQLTKRSNIDMQELAFFHLEGGPDGF